MLDVPSLADLNLVVAAPVVFLSLYVTILLLVDVLFIPKERKIVTAYLTMFSLFVAFILVLIVFDKQDTAMYDMFIADAFTSFANITVLITAFITVLLSIDYMKRTKTEQSEFYVLLLFSVIGVMMMASANNLIVIFVALELLSIPLYVLVAMRHDSAKSEEGGIKYFIMGAFSSAFFVYGAALIYGATGTIHLPEIFAAVQHINGDTAEVYYLLVGTGMIVVALGFKVAVVPFHMWTPDVYEGAPTPVTAFMSVAAKVGGFAALLRIVTLALPEFMLETGDPAAWQTTMLLIAAVTMILGNFVAVAQTNIKRMLAYSSIAHAGYILMAVAAAGSGDSVIAETATKAAMVYLMTYMFTNLGAFAIVLGIEKDDGTGTDVDDFMGLSKSKPLLAMMMAVFMLSLTGIPLTGGFVGKWLVFSAALQADLVWLTVIGVLTSVVSAYYYVRVIVNMYLKEGEGDPATGATEYVTYAAMIAFSGTVLLGFFPNLALDLLDKVNIAFTMIF